MAGLDIKKDEKLGSLEDDYTADFYTKIKDLIDERDKKLKEVTDFNNKVKQAELDYQQKLKEQGSGGNTSNANNERMQDALKRDKYQAALDYYSKMSKSDARLAFNNDASVLKNDLGDYYGVLSIALGF